jgi:hypothetical protein
MTDYESGTYNNSLFKLILMRINNIVTNEINHD